MVDENILPLTLEITISTKVIFEFAKSFDIHVRHSDVHICARRLPGNTQASSLWPKQLWRAKSNVEVMLSEKSAALAILRSQATLTTQPSISNLLSRFTRRCRITLLPFPPKGRG
jgi:hypothetical protein